MHYLTYVPHEYQPTTTQVIQTNPKEASYALAKDTIQINVEPSITLTTIETRI